MDENKEWVEVEVNAPAETPKADVTPVEEPQETSTTSSTGTTKEPELGHRAEKRIKQLLARVKDSEERAARAESLARVREEEAQKALEKAKGTESSAYGVYRSSLQDRLKAAEQKYKSAYDAADKDALFEANLEMSKATVELQALDAWDRAEKEKAAVPAPPPPPQQAPAQLQLAPITKEWMDSNPWFGRGPNADRTATAAAVAISDDLIEEGFDPTSPEFYGEVEKRLVAEMPRMASKLGKEKEPEPRRPMVAGQSRTPGRRVRLDEGTVRASTRLGASLEDTARYMEKIQDAGDGYVNIDVKRGRK